MWNFDSSEDWTKEFTYSDMKKHNQRSIVLKAVGIQYAKRLWYVSYKFRRL
jgi:hypothetical protein